PGPGFPKQSLTLLEGLPSILEGSKVPPAASLADDPEPPARAVERDPPPDREIGKHRIHAEIAMAEETGRVHSRTAGVRWDIPRGARERNEPPPVRRRPPGSPAGRGRRGGAGAA